jgi:hypothetical protein
MGLDVMNGVWIGIALQHVNDIFAGIVGRRGSVETNSTHVGLPAATGLKETYYLQSGHGIEALAIRSGDR